jgi:hypothetical protein
LLGYFDKHLEDLEDKTQQGHKLQYDKGSIIKQHAIFIELQ